MVTLVWTEVALEDLRLIHEFISKDSQVYADRFTEKIIARVEQLQTFSRSGRVVPEFGMETLRELIEGNYRIIYQIHASYIGIVRIHHSARQLK